MELRYGNSSLVEHVVGIWVKQHNSPLDQTDPLRWSYPTYPYKVKSVDQVFPGREHLEEFESRRNELDQRLSKGKVKLETIHGFYCPSSEDNLRLILKEGFHNAFVGELTFCLDPLQAIRESLSSRPASKIILARVSLGWKEYDYTEINNKYKIKNLRGVLPAFVINIEQVPLPQDQGGDVVKTYVSPRQERESPRDSPRMDTPTSSPSDSPSSFTTATRVPKYIRDLNKDDESQGGIPCIACGRVAGPGSSGRFCISCGEKIP